MPVVETMGALAREDMGGHEGDVLQVSEVENMSVSGK
jgi:hypothetical protein